MSGVAWYRRAGVWIGIGINAASLTVGGGLAARLPMSTLPLLVPLGAAALVGLALAQSLIARRRREPLARRARAVFGNGRGTGFFQLLIVLGMMGWNGFYIGITGVSAANLLGLPLWVGALLMALLVLLLSELGVNRWNGVVWLTTLAAFAVAVTALVAVDARPTFAGPLLPAGPGDLLWAVGSIVAYAILFALRSADFAWDMRSDRDVVIDALIFAVPLVAALFMGAALFQATGDWNIPDILATTELARLGQIFLIISSASPVLGSTYSGALAFSNLTGITHRMATALLLLVAFGLGATRFDRQLLPMLQLLGAVLPPALIVLLLAARFSIPPRQAVAAWLLGAVAALGVQAGGGPVHIVAGAATSTLALLPLRWAAGGSHGWRRANNHLSLAAAHGPRPGIYILGGTLAAQRAADGGDGAGLCPRRGPPAGQP